MKIWTKDEINFLIFAYPRKDFSVKEISNLLGRNEKNIRQKATRLNLLRPKDIIPIGFKRCSKCKTILPQTLEFFYNATSSKDSLSYYCLFCDSQREKKRRLKNDE